MGLPRSWPVACEEVPLTAAGGDDPVPPVQPGLRAGERRHVARHRAPDRAGRHPRPRRHGRAASSRPSAWIEGRPPRHEGQLRGAASTRRDGLLALRLTAPPLTVALSAARTRRPPRRRAGRPGHGHRDGEQPRASRSRSGARCPRGSWSPRTRGAHRLATGHDRGERLRLPREPGAERADRLLGERGRRSRSSWRAEARRSTPTPTVRRSTPSRRGRRSGSTRRRSTVTATPPTERPARCRSP